MQTTHRAAFSIQLAAADFQPTGGWYQMLPAGSFAGRDGRGPYVNADPANVLAAFGDWGMPVTIDYEHQSLSAEDKAGPVPASGWAKALDIRNGEVWAQIDWTETAAKLIGEKAYMYLSPVFEYDRASGVVLRLVGAGLTNNPNLFLQPLTSHRKEQPMPDDTLRAVVCQSIGLAASASDQSISARIAELLNPPELAALRLTAQAEAGADLATVLKAAHVKLTTLTAELASRDQELTTIKAAAHRAEVEALIDAELKSDKPRLSPAQRDWAINHALSDRAAFDAFLKSAPPVISTHRQAPTGAKPGNGDAIDPRLLAAKAQTYIAEMAKQGVSVSADQAVFHVRGNA